VSGAPFSAFDFELTESVFAEVDDRTLLQIANLRRRGARFTIDDFGSGFSSMRYIKDFPVDRIKIDKYFVDHIAGDERTHKVVDAMVQLAYSIGAEVVAEGVETHAQVQALVHAGCHVIQGYIVGRPMGVEALSDLIRTGRVGLIGKEVPLRGRAGG
jgi:EAL domain-containing protein (putative c-di-GMP-specific phosphodiesterase class I)